MSELLFDLHQGKDQLWKWHGAKPGHPNLIVSRRSYERRQEASAALTRYLRLLRL